MTNSGYGKFQLKGRSRLAHRVAWELANGPIKSGLCVCHRCDVKLCINPEHMFIGSVSDNAVDMRQKDRHPAGLKRADAAAAKAMLAIGARVKDVAARFGVAACNISNMKRGRTYRSV